MQRKILSVAAAVIFAVTATVTVYAESAKKLCYLENTDKSGIGVSAVSAILIEADTGTVLFSKNEKEHRQIASTTKIMTALLTLEAGEPDKEFEVDPTAIKVEGTSMGLREGDIVTRRALCYGMLLPSGNDAANAAAVNISGSKSAFAVLMNKRAEEIGMTDTNFVTPSGLDADGQYSCAYDLALLTREAMNNKDFAKICGLPKAKVSFGNPKSDRILVNSNKLLTSYDGCIGVKTGYTRHAGRILVSAAERDGRMLIAVTISDPDDWRDHTALLDYGFAVLGRDTPVYPQNRRIVWKNECKKFWRAAQASRAAISSSAQLGEQADAEEDVIELDGTRVKTRQEPQPVYLMLCKPRGFVTTMHDEKGRRSVAELVADVPERVYPVGRLDYNSEGLLLMTNDGVLANALMHPKKSIDKTYLVWVSGYIAGKEQSLSQSIEIDGRKTSPAAVQLLHEAGTTALFRVTIHEGRNRQIRRLCERAELTVTRLRRVQEGQLTLGDLKPGQHRPLTETELRAIFEEIQK